MNRTVAIFRASLVAFVLLEIAVIVKVLLIGHGHLPEPARAYLRWWHETPQSAVERAVAWIGLLTVAIAIASALAMTAFARWARPVFAVCIALICASELLIDYPVLKSPIEYFLEAVLGVVAGAIIVFSYWSRAADGFAKNAP